MRSYRPALATLAAFCVVACVSQSIGDPDAYSVVSLARVVPFPSDEELASQQIDVVLAAHYTDELPKARVGAAMTGLFASLDTYLTAAGAGVIDRSIHDLVSVRDELEAAEAGTGELSYTRADFAVVARIEKFRRWSEYRPPSSLFKSDRDLKREAGECLHHGEVEVLLRAFQVPTNDVPRATYRLEHAGLLEETQFDRSCPLDEARELVFLESLVKQVTPCLEGPVQNGFAPRGYVEEQRRGADGGLDIYRTSLGRRNGARPRLGLRVHRVRYETTPEGERLRSERPIGTGRLSDQIGETYSWIVLDAGGLREPVLAGDLVRAVYEDPQASMFGTGLCERALTFQGRL